MRIAIVCCMFVMFAWGTLANASVVTVNFSGTVTQVPVDEVFGDISFGEIFDGSFTFDTSAADLIPGDPSTGSFSFSAPLGMKVNLGSHTFSATGISIIGILNGFVDQYTVLAMSSAIDLSLELFLQDKSGTALSSDQLPANGPAFEAFAQRDFHLDALFAGGEVQVDGRLNTASAQVVPDLSPWATTLVGSLIFLTRARRRRTLQSIN